MAVKAQVKKKTSSRKNPVSKAKAHKTVARPHPRTEAGAWGRSTPTKIGRNSGRYVRVRETCGFPESSAAPVQDWLQPALLVGGLIFAWLGQDQLFARQLAWGLGLWLAAGALLAASFWKTRPAPAEPFTVSKRWEIALVLGVVAIAAVIRVWNLAKLPNGFFFDEAMNGLIGLQMIVDPHYVPLFGPSDAPAPTLFHYFNSLALRLGGVNVAAARMVPACLGIATVAMFYFLARRLYSRPVALAMVLVFAVMRWHINFSRIDFIGAATPLFAIAAGYFLLRGMETKNRWHMALSGLAVAMGLYTYYASNLVPFVLGPYMVMQLAWDRKFIREQWKNVLVFLAVSVVVFAPLGHFAFTQKDRFFARNGQVLIFNHVSPAQAAEAFWLNVKTTLLMFNYYGDCNGRHNIPEVPMLDFTTGLLFGVGLIWCLKNFQKKHAFLALLWFLVALVPGFLTIEAPQSYRCIGAIVPVALLAGFGLEALWQGFLDLARATPVQRWLWVGLIPLAGWIGYQNLNDYFARQAKHMACWSEFSAREAAIGGRLRELGSSYHAYISAGSFDYPTIRFLGYPSMESEPFNMVQSVPSHYQGAKNLVYCLLPIHENAQELLNYYYPQGKQQIYSSPFEFNLFYEYRISAGELQASRGLTGEYTNEAGQTARRQDGSKEFAIAPGSAPLPGTLSVRWSGCVQAAAWDTYLFRADGASNSRIRIDGAEVTAQGAELSQGLHRIEIYATFASAQGMTLVWKRRASEIWSVIPGHDLTPQTKIHGLAGTYYMSPDAKGIPYLKRVDPFMSLLGADFPLSAPFSVRWEGILTIEKAGGYSFGTLNNQFSWVYIDDKLVVANTVADGYQESPLRLTAGKHRIRIEFQKREGAYPTFVLYWTPPRQSKQKVPFKVFEPE
jgi:4-amino-4-deoxy-L-arabinose transferase-like glycosyltransferase